MEPAAVYLDTLRYEVDLTEKLYNVYINGEPAAQGYPVGATLTAAETRLELFEIQPEETMKFAMDNLRVVQNPGKPCDFPHRL